jgi:hypothetical protein
LRFVPSRNAHINPAKGYYSNSFDNLYRALILNYDLTRDEMEEIEQPVLLIVYAENADATYNSKLSEFIRWKKQKGYIVNSFSTTVTGTTTTSIKAYIQSQYDNQITRPDIVLLIGDTSGSYPIPTNYESSFSNSYGDYSYSLLEGNDQYGEIQIGRISISNSEEFAAYVNKTIFYESKINTDNASWLNKMLLIGHTGVINDVNASGISTVFTNKYIKEISSIVNPNYIYSEHYGNLSSYYNEINTAITSGVGIFNYRGWIGMSGWSTHITANETNNPIKYNHGVFITCNTGSFATSTSPTEQYIRIGTSAIPKGGITAIGMDTSSTHTGMNNGLDGALFDGIFNHGMRSMGEALLFSKCYMHSVFDNSNLNLVTFFVRICNLMGDPTAEIYVSIPKTFSVTCPSTLLSGSSLLEVTVLDVNQSHVSKATVDVWHSTSGLRKTAYTNDDGKVFIDLPTNIADSVLVTISKHDFKPYTKYVKFSGTGIVYQSSLIDDDNNGQSHGNGNGILSAGEVIEYQVSVRNTTDGDIRSVSAVMSENDPHITLISNSMSISAISSNTTALLSAVRFSISNDCPNNHPVVFNLAGSSSAGTWEATIRLIVQSPDLDYLSYSINGSNLNIGIYELATMSINLINNGTENIAGVFGILRSNNNYLEIVDSLKYFGDMNVGSNLSNANNPFNISSSLNAVVGMVIPLELYLYNSIGYIDTEYFSLTIGNPIVTDPLGQDEYGYFIYDIGDTSYPDCPTYDWIGIAPVEGGAGTPLSVTDTYTATDEGDQIGCDATEVVNLPFVFKYYGVNYGQITVVSNGFLVFGVTANHDFRNWRIPGAVGPNSMIAAFWDDLATHSGSGIYSFYDSVNHIYIIEWYNMLNGYNGSSEETFQIILYDPAFYPTQSGDGQIKIQYKVFNNISSSTGTGSHGCYSTIGIKDHTGLRGLEYSFNNQYPIAARPLTNSSSLFITTQRIIPQNPQLTITNSVLVDTNGNGIAEPNEILDTRLTVTNHGSADAVNVQITISETDPWISILSNNATLGNIGSLASASNTNGLTISVLEGCPNNYNALVDAIITCNGYSFNTSFIINVKSPILQFSEGEVLDLSGNNNGNLDPGETVTILMQLFNNGGVSSQPGIVTLSCSANGITINNPNEIQIPSIISGGSENLQFSISASSNISIGTIIEFNIEALTSNCTASKVVYIEIGAPIEITIGTGTATQSYPIDRYYNYSVHEAIYLASEIGTPGYIKSIGYYKSSGSNLDSIEAVTIYLKNTSNSTMTTGNFNTDGYTQVYNGNFTNTAITGWMEVTLDSYFEYNGIDNLAILIIKNYQLYVSGYPQWTYSITTNSRARQNHSDSAMPTSLTSSTYLPNIKLKVFTNNDILFPPRSLNALSGNLKVSLTWQPPVSGNPTSYNIYRNSVLLTSANSLTYIDYNVENGIEYTYYTTANYTTIPIGESESSNVVSANPTATPFVTIGESTTTQRQPFGMYFGFERDASLYLSNEIGLNGNILSLQWYVSSAQTTSAPITIKLLTTTESSLSAAPWSTIIDNATTVYTNNSLSFANTGWHNLSLDTPYPYTSGNLLVLVETNYGGSGFSTYPSFRYSSSPAGCHQLWATDNSAPTGNGTVNINRPNLRIQMETTAPVPSITVNPTQFNFGQVYVGLSPTIAFSITNSGEGILDGQITTPVGYSILQDRYSLSQNSKSRSQRNTLTYSILSGQSKSFAIEFNPTLNQSYNGFLTITSDDPDHIVTELPITGNGVMPIFASPTNLNATASMGTVSLTWTAPSVIDGELTGYKIYRNGSILTPNIVTLTSYTDVGLVNEVPYQYYITAIYSNPSGESEASNSINATPTAYIPVVGTIGSGTSISANNHISPINLTYRSVHGQSVYKASELNSAGIYGPVYITHLGFNVATSPANSLPNFIIRMKHTIAIDAQAWHTADSLVTVYTSPSYMPAAGGFDMLVLSTPFLWNGVDNIVLDTAFSLVNQFSNTGTLQYTTQTNGFRAARLDTEDQTNVFTGGFLYSRRANIRIQAQNFQLTAPVVSIEELNNGVRISWEAVNGAQRYKVFSSQNAESGFTELAEVVTHECIIVNTEQYQFFKVIAIRN